MSPGSREAILRERRPLRITTRPDGSIAPFELGANYTPSVNHLDV